MLSKKIAEIIPNELGLNNDLYGLQFGSVIKDINLHKIVICLDPTLDVILQASKLKSYLIIAHHGLTHHPILYFNEPILKQVKLLSINNISLFVIHSAWIAAPGGISDTITEALGLKIIDNFYIQDEGGEKPIGRIGIPILEDLTMGLLIKSYERKFHSKFIQICGDISKKIKKIAIIWGISLRTQDLIDIINLGCDTLISSELNHSQFIIAQNLGLNILNFQHYVGDKIAIKKLQLILSLEFPRDEFIFVDSKNPIMFPV